MAIGSYSGASVVLDLTGGISISPIPPTKIKPYTKFFETSSGNRSMVVNGSTTPVEFFVSPPSGVTWYCECLTFGIDDGGQCFPFKYGALNELTNGVKIELVLGTISTEIVNLKNNGDIILTFNQPAGFIFVGRYMEFTNGFTGRLVFSTYITLDGTNGDQFKVTIRDDLRGINFQRMSAQVWEISND